MAGGLKRAREAARQTRVERLPQVGDVYEDNDPRSAGRTLRVDAIEGTKAACTVLTNSDEVQRQLDGFATGDFSLIRAAVIPRNMRGKTTRISLSRFKPTSTGYRLIKPGED